MASPCVRSMFPSYGPNVLDAHANVFCVGYSQLRTCKDFGFSTEVDYRTKFQFRQIDIMTLQDSKHL